MSRIHFSLILFLSLYLSTTTTTVATSQPQPSSPYLSPATLFKDYENMVRSFKIFAYTPAGPFSYNALPESLFYSSLLNSQFVTKNPEEAHLFFIPFEPGVSSRNLDRLIREIRTQFPYWDRTLGADHFSVSCDGFPFATNRNLLELKKNSVLLSCFPSQLGKFIPHKDLTLPPFANTRSPLDGTENGTYSHLGYVRFNWVKESSLVDELTGDSDFLVESEPSDQVTYEERLESSRFCLFDYESGDISEIGEALRFGCVPVVITGRPIQDLPLMDVLTWQEIALFVGSAGGVENMKRVLNDALEEERYEGMKRLGVKAGQHLSWYDAPQPYDAFHMVMYQLWLRRHTIRYTVRDWE